LRAVTILKLLYAEQRLTALESESQEDVTFKRNIHFIESHDVLPSRRRQLPDMNQQVIELNRLIKIHGA
jgi:hypothetical protein